MFERSRRSVPGMTMTKRMATQLVAVGQELRQVLSREDLSNRTVSTHQTEGGVVRAHEAVRFENCAARFICGMRKVIKGERDQRDTISHGYGSTKERPVRCSCVQVERLISGRCECL